MISFKKFVRSDYQTLISWVKSEEELMQFAGPAFYFPLTGQQLDNSLADPNRYVFKVVETENQSTIGHAEVYIKGNDTYLARILIGDKSNRSKGFGQMLVKQLLRFVFTELQRPNVQLNVFDWNNAAIQCYQNVGFVVDPTKKSERMVNEKTWTVTNMRLEKAEANKNQ